MNIFLKFTFTYSYQSSHLKQQEKILRIMTASHCSMKRDFRKKVIRDF